MHKKAHTHTHTHTHTESLLCMHSKRFNLLAEIIETGMYATGANQPVNPRSLIKAFSVQNIFCSIKWVCAWTTKALIRLPEYAGWPGPSLYAYAIKAFFSWSVVYICFYRKIKIMSKMFTIKFVTYAAVYELTHCYIQVLLFLLFFSVKRNSLLPYPNRLLWMECWLFQTLHIPNMYMYWWAANKRKVASGAYANSEGPD